MRLILRNVFQMLPGISDKSTQGNPGKYSFCIAERARGNPWPLLCEAQGYAEGVSSVTVFAGGGFCNVENHGGNTPEQVLGSVADAMANYGCITLGQSVVILAPEHMRIVAGAGWTREDAQDFLFADAKRSVEGMKGVGKYRDREYDKQHGEGAHALAEAGLRASRARARRYPDHDGRRRRRRPFVLHPVVEPRPRLDHAARPDRLATQSERGVEAHAALRPHLDHAEAQGVPRARRSPASTACGSASWRTASSTPRRC